MIQLLMSFLSMMSAVRLPEEHVLRVLSIHQHVLTERQHHSARVILDMAFQEVRISLTLHTIHVSRANRYKCRHVSSRNLTLFFHRVSIAPSALPYIGSRAQR